MEGKKKPNRKPQRSYSDDDKANALVALDANAGDVAKTARQLSIPRKTLAEWAKGRIHEAVATSRQEKKEPLADRLEEVAHLLIDSMPSKIGESSLKDVTISMGISLEKMRLLREQPTSITGKELSDEERVARFNRLVDRVNARRAGGVGDHLNGNGRPAVEPAVGSADSGL